MTEEDIILAGWALPGAGVPSDAPSFDYRDLLGRSAELQPVGENIVLDDWLPRQSTLTRQIALEDWGIDWLVLQFDEPIEYMNRRYDYSIIRARWFGVPVGSDFCPVFLLLDKDRVLDERDIYSSSQFQFVSWGKVVLVGN